MAQTPSSSQTEARPITTEELKLRVQACVAVYTSEGARSAEAAKALNITTTAQFRDFLVSCEMLQLGFQLGQHAAAEQPASN